MLTYIPSLTISNLCNNQIIPRAHIGIYQVACIQSEEAIVQSNPQKQHGLICNPELF